MCTLDFFRVENLSVLEAITWQYELAKIKGGQIRMDKLGIGLRVAADDARFQ